VPLKGSSRDLRSNVASLDCFDKRDQVAAAYFGLDAEALDERGCPRDLGGREANDGCE
jgi:hypothetical protein